MEPLTVILSKAMYLIGDKEDYLTMYSRFQHFPKLERILNKCVQVPKYGFRSLILGNMFENVGDRELSIITAEVWIRAVGANLFDRCTKNWLHALPECHSDPFFLLSFLLPA